MKKLILFSIAVLAQFIDRENPGRILSPGETLVTDDVERVNNIVKSGLGEIVSVDVKEEAAGQAAQQAPKDPVAKMVAFQGEEYDVETVKKALGEIGAKVAANAGVNGVSNAIAKLTEENQKALSEKLAANAE
jgi:hypothetical protein